jgi:hypothetical protein
MVKRKIKGGYNELRNCRIRRKKKERKKGG